MQGTAQYDLYWRTVSSIAGDRKHELYYKLEDAGYDLLKQDSYSKGELAELAKRLDTEKPYYDNCTMSELRQFVRDRRINLVQSRDERRSLISALCMVDDWPTFFQFMELPPELRARVYEMYVAEFPEWLKTPTQPPLARLSRTLRREVLPIFYSTCGFKLVYARSADREKKETRPMKAEVETALWLSHLATADLGAMRRMEMTLYGVSLAPIQGFYFICVIERTGSGRYKTLVKGSHGRTAVDGPQSRGAVVEAAVNEALKHVQELDGSGGLNSVDLRAVIQAVERSLAS